MNADAVSLDGLRVDQVGSLLRPDALKEAYRRHELGQMDDAALQAAQDEAIRQGVARQEAIGFPVVTDGEFRRLNFQESFAASVSGFDQSPATFSSQERRTEGGRPLQRWDPGYTGPGPAVTVRRPAVERLRLRRNLPLEEYRFAGALTPRPVKVTLVSPDRIAQRFDLEGSRGVYRDMDDFLADVVAIQRQVIAELAAAGCRYVQIDAPSYTAYVDPPSLTEWRRRGEDPDLWLRRSIEADNAVIRGFPGVTFGIHVCRGNQRSMWHREGSYDAIAERLFTGLNHQRLLLEYDSERAGGFEPLRFVPRDKVVVLGLVSTKVPDLERPEDLARRVDAAARYVPGERLALSPQCGFASGLAGNLLGDDDQWRKLELVLQVAARLWG